METDWRQFYIEAVSLFIKDLAKVAESECPYKSRSYETEGVRFEYIPLACISLNIKGYKNLILTGDRRETDYVKHF